MMTTIYTLQNKCTFNSIIFYINKQNKLISLKFVKPTICIVIRIVRLCFTILSPAKLVVESEYESILLEVGQLLVQSVRGVGSLKVIARWSRSAE